MDLESLVLRLESTGGGNVGGEVVDVGNKVEQTAEKTHKAGEAFNFAEAGVFGFSEAIRMATGVMTEFIESLALLVGIEHAAAIERLTGRFAALTGSVEKAGAAIKEIKELSDNSQFSVAQLGDIMNRFIATGASPNEAMRKTRALEGAGSAMMMDPGELSAVSNALIMMREMPMVMPRQLRELGQTLPLSKVLEAGGGAHTDSAATAARMLSAMGGAHASEVLMRGIEKLYGDSAGRINGFSAALSAFGHTVSEIMEPTGAVIIGFLTPFAVDLRNIAGVLGNINELTHGWAGIGAIIYTLIRTQAFLVQSYNVAIGAIRRLTLALDELAVAGGAAARSTAAEATASGAMAVTGGAAVAGGAAGILKGGGLLKGLGIGLLVAGISDLLGGFLSSHGQEKLGGQVSTIGAYGGTGAAIGSLFGPEGTVIGLLGGLIVGEMKTLWDNAHGEKSDVEKNTARAADALEDIRGQMIGGGRRAARVSSEIELEHALSHLMIHGGALTG